MAPFNKEFDFQQFCFDPSKNHTTFSLNLEYENGTKILYQFRCPVVLADSLNKLVDIIPEFIEKFENLEISDEESTVQHNKTIRLRTLQKLVREIKAFVSISKRFASYFIPNDLKDVIFTASEEIINSESYHFIRWAN